MITPPDGEVASRAHARTSRWGRTGPVRDEEISSSPQPLLLDRLSAWVTEHRKLVPRFIAEPRPSLDQRLLWARRGEWTTTLKSPARSWMAAWTYVVWVPFAVAADVADLVSGFWEWAARTPGRFVPSVLVTVVVVAALNTVPLLGAVIPDGLSVLSYPPLSWIG